MTQKELESKLREFVNYYKKIDKVWTDFEKHSGAQIDGPLGTAFWDTFDRYTQLFSKEIYDGFDEVSWFIWDNDCGKNEKEVAVNGKFKKIKNIRDLAKILLIERET